MNDRLTMLLRTIAVVLLATLALATPAMASDHDDDHHHGTSTSTATAGSGQHDLGAFIRAGSCDQPGDVVEDIGDLDPDDSVWRVIGNDEPQPDVVFGEDEDIHRTVAELASGDFIVTIHERDDASAPVIACGEIAGEVDADGTLTIDLESVDGSGYVGRVHVTPEHDGDDETEVTVGVWRGDVVTPEATPGS